MLGLLALNSLSSTDTIFFIVLAAIIVLCIGVYFLIPVINKKQYRELRDNLKKREAAFKSNVQRTDGAPIFVDDPSEEEDLPAEQIMTFSDDMPLDPTEDEEK